MKQNTYLILPGCDDTNRGDQALIWETVSLAKAAGYIGNYYMLANSAQCHQSKDEGIDQVNYILEHPSTRFQSSQNIHYTPWLKLKWAFVAIGDIISREPLVNPILRKALLPLYSRKTRQALEIFQNANVSFVKGGGFLHAHGSLADTYKIYYFLYHIRLALSMGSQVIVMPNSFGPFNSPFVKKMVQKVLSRCKAVMARESISAQQLSDSCGISASVFSDLAFHLKADDAFDPKKRLRDAGIPLGSKPCVAITARPYRFPEAQDSKAKYHAYQNSIVNFMVYLSENGYHPVLVEHVFSEMDHENDMTCIRQISALVQDRCEYSIFTDRTLTSRQMKRIYGSFDYTVGTRFHSVIFSLASGVPSIAITYGGNKGLGIMKDLGLGDYALPIESLSDTQLIQVFTQLTENKTRLTAALREQQLRMSTQKQQIMNIIVEND